MNFNYYLPVNLLFGPGKVSLIGKEVSRHGNKALIVTGRSSTKKTGLLDRVISYIESENVECFVFDKVEQNPLTTTVEEGVKYLKYNNCDIVVGLGGGSAMDAAKGIAFSAVNPGDVSQYIYGKPGNGALPVIAVTTTAGTGSEGDSFAVLTNPETKDKKSLRTPYIYPKASIVDPELMTTLPPHIIAFTGIDALCHAIEGYISKKSNPFSDMMALKAIELISSNLEKVYKDPRDIDSWCSVALGNTLGGMVIDMAGTALPHAMEHPISGLLNVVHGQGLAALTLPVMEFSYMSLPQKFVDIAKAMGEDVYGLSPEEDAARSMDAVKKLLEKVNLTPRLRDMGVLDEHIDWMANNSIKIMKAAIDNNPRVPNIEDIKEIYIKSM